VLPVVAYIYKNQLVDQLSEYGAANWCLCTFILVVPD